MKLREWRGTTRQADLCKALGVSERQYRRWEQGETEPPAMLLILARLISPEALGAPRTGRMSTD